MNVEPLDTSDSASFPLLLEQIFILPDFQPSRSPETLEAGNLAVDGRSESPSTDSSVRSLTQISTFTLTYPSVARTP